MNTIIQLKFYIYSIGNAYICNYFKWLITSKFKVVKDIPRRLNQKGTERLTDAIAYRITATQRAFLERLSEERNVGLCEAARIVLDDVMTRGLSV